MGSRILGSLLPAYFALAVPSLANDACNFLSEQKFGPLQDGQLFASGKEGWQTFSSLSELVARSPQEAEFVYVIRTAGNIERSGVLIVKTNRPATEKDPEKLRNKVKLVRREVVADVGCAAVGDPNYETSVSTQSFRDYHDFPPRATAALRKTVEGGTVIESEAIKGFHFDYRSARKRKCVRTDNAEYDEFPGNLNSNRAQFSFDRTVVASGSYSVARLFFWVPVSPFEGAAEHRVLVRKYTTRAGLACVRFKVPLQSTDYTFQVNDLESRVSESSNSRKEQVGQKWPAGN